jgi:hypothetical protein
MALLYTNLLQYYTLRMDGDTLIFPSIFRSIFCAPFVEPLTAAEPAVLEILDNPSNHAGQTSPVVGDIISPAEMIETFIRLTGQKAAYASAYKPEDWVGHLPDFASNPELVREIIAWLNTQSSTGIIARTATSNGAGGSTRKASTGSSSSETEAGMDRSKHSASRRLKLFL